MPRFQDPKEAEQIMFDAGAIPLEPYKGSQIKWKCRCKKCKKIIYPTLAPIKNRGVRPCKDCARTEAGEKRKSKSSKSSLAIMKKANFLPLEDYPGNSKGWKSKCLKCGKISKPHLATVKNGSSCQFCAGVKISEEDVRRIYKKAGYLPIGKYEGSSKIKWKSKHLQCGNVVSPDFSKVKIGLGCPYCAGNAKISESSARKLFLKNKLEPLEPFVNSQKPWKSKCLITGKIVSPTYGKVRDYGHRCKYCSENVTDEVDAIELMRKAGFKTIDPFPGGNKPWKSQCLKCKKIFSPNFTSIKMGHGCKFCSSNAVDPKDAVAIMLKRGFKTLGPYPGATNLWKVECLTCGKKFETRFGSSRSLKSCRFCAGRDVDVQDLLDKLKELNLKPLEEYKSAKTPWKCKCLVCNHVVQPTWNRIKQGRGPCAYCAQRRVDIPEALKFMKTLKLKPLVDFPGGNTPWRCKCLKCGLEATPRWSDLRQGQGGCSNCADYGLNYQLPGYIYLITHEKLSAHKIGIANSYKNRRFDDRMYKHEKQGWMLFKKMNFKTVKEAANIESAILEWLRMDVGLGIHLASSQMPQGGWTETVDSSEIDLSIIWAKVEELSKVKK